MRDLSIKKVPVPKGDDHIPPPGGHGIMPVHEFTMGLIAPKGSGKTTTIVNLLEIYAGYFHKIYIFSPTIKSDSKWDYVKKLKLLIDNKPLKKYLNDLANQKDIKSPVQPAPMHLQLKNLVGDEKFQEEIPEENFYTFYNEKDFREIVEKNKAIVDLLKDNGKLKTLADRILFIMDDQVGSEMFRGTSMSYFKGFNTRHRHYSASVIMVSQGNYFISMLSLFIFYIQVQQKNKNY